ncbi:MAG: Rha family transcriptional regulator [Burkholderiales bacterium]|nr:Rha family transcriptional regulator [Burkholderiales bacterium]
MHLIKLEELIKTHLVMTSRDIADLTGKTVGHINRDIKAMLKELKPSYPDLDSEYRTVCYEQNTGFGVKLNTMFELDKRLTLCLTSGYSAKLRLKIIDRVAELESENNSLKARIKSAHDDMELIKVH